MALETDPKKIPVEVPASYIKEKDIDLENESFAFLGSSFCVDGFKFRIPSLGVMALLETFESRFITMKNATVVDMIRALYINAGRESVADDVCDWYNTGMKADHSFSVDAFAWAHKELPFIDIEDDDETWHKNNIKATKATIEIQEKFLLCHTGFEMIPSGGGGGCRSNGKSATMLYGAETMGSLLATCGGLLGCSWQEILWEVPLTTLGHLLASEHRKGGTEGVSRPKCPDDIKKQLRDAQERVIKGELFQWQIDRPLDFVLSEVQKTHAPGLQKKFDLIVNKARKEREKNGRP